MKNFLRLVSIGMVALMGVFASDAIAQHAPGTVGQASQALPAIVVSVRAVDVAGNTNVGRPVGAVAGAVAGSAIGGNRRVNILGGLGGAVAGGAVGGSIQSGMSSQTAIEYVVELQNGGGFASVIQPMDGNIFSVGQRVLFIMGPPARLIADTRQW